MFHEEKIIDGKLCYRTDPDGEWVAYTYEQVVGRYLAATHTPPAQPPSNLEENAKLLKNAAMEYLKSPTRPNEVHLVSALTIMELTLRGLEEARKEDKK